MVSRETEVAELELAAVGEEEIAELQIAVEDPAAVEERHRLEG